MGCRDGKTELAANENGHRSSKFDRETAEKDTF